MRKIYLNLLASICLVCALIMGSCRTYPEMEYFRNIDEQQVLKIAELNNTSQLTIQPLDLLDIRVYSFDPIASAPFNPLGANLITNREGQVYRVNDLGLVDFPVLGKLDLAGKTINEAETIFLKEVSKYLKDPVINVRFTNLKVTILGEVTRPGTYPLVNEYNTLLHAIGMAGDLTIYGSRNDIMVIRETNGKREIGLLDLNSPEFFKSPFYVLKQNDVIYIKPTPLKDTQVNSATQREILPWISVGISTISVIVLAISRL